MKKVLIVDDTKNIRVLLTACLELEGYEVISSKNGEEALDLFTKESFDLAFLDIKMPELSGTEVLRRIRSMGFNTPVVIMTAFGTVKNAVECTRLGAVAYLQKPFTADKVRNLLNELKNDASSDIDTNINTAKKLIDELKLESALNVLKNTLPQDINRAEIYSLIGKIYELTGEQKEAERFYNISKQFE
ncbi:response regulator [Clostridium sp. YIM B02515]|uniref:Stage 0 sporulation protein A homolog n=1 Tax=Clostridium rhizosphaerae TaxID=2803861 RepID=A0ABS1TCG6_9CLOT|nr:response regulator [Clostridium rhizosphaerae]MBL4937048.1 response regulator [Clostridium rhizosphaerae]